MQVFFPMGDLAACSPREILRNYNSDVLISHILGVFLQTFLFKVLEFSA